MSTDFQEKLVDLAKRLVAAASNCPNEQATKMFLIIPFISFLGYDDTNPNEVFPEHHADFSEKYKNRVDFAILRNSAPIIAIECKCWGTPLKDERGQLRSYFNAAKTVRVGVLTNGLQWEFFSDSDEPNLMDETPFLSLDLEEVAKGKLSGSALDALLTLGKTSFDPENIGAEAKRKHIFNSVLKQIGQLAQDPSEPFCRMLLQNAGMTRIRQKALEDYKSIVQRAFHEFIYQNILLRLSIPKPEPETESESGQEPKPANPERNDSKINTTETELAVFRWVQQRLAFLVRDDLLYGEIRNIGFRDYQSKFVIYYKKERKGRLFDFIEGKGDEQSPKYHFIFPDDATEGSKDISTNELKDIDIVLLASFRTRVHALADTVLESTIET
jgi:hypothetical protein